MSFPYTDPIGTQSEAITAITAVETAIAQCMAAYYGDTLLPLIVAEPVEAQIGLFKTTMCAMSIKEKSIANVINALANKTYADKGLAPCYPDDCCSC